MKALPVHSGRSIIVEVGRPVSHVFVGRDAELNKLQSALEAAASGKPSIVLIGGEAGVGKTRLVRELTDRINGSAQVLYGRCVPVADGELPFAPFVEAFRPSTPGTKGSGFLVATFGDARGTATGDTVLRAQTRSLAVAGWTAQARVFELVLEEVRRRSADAPLVLVLEDLHWADRSSRELLLFLARNLGSEALLLLATYRSDELHRRHPLLATLAELGRTPAVDRVELRRLTGPETAQLVRSLVSDELPPRTVEEIVGRAEGVPFHAEELLTATLAGGSSNLTPSLTETLTVRLAGLPPEAHRLVCSAAAIGRRADHRLVAAVAGVDEPRLLEALRHAVDHHILEVVESEDGSWSGYEFRHALLAEVAYAELLPAERAATHQRIAAALEAVPVDAATTPALRAAEVAYHWARAQVPDRALAAAIAAGRGADRAHAWAEALSQYRRALELWSRVADAPALAGLDEAALLGLAADAANNSADPSAAARFAESALEQLPGDASVERRIALLEALYAGRWEAGQPLEARAALDTALALLPPSSEPRLRARILSYVGWVAFLEDRFDDARAASEEAVALARGTGDAEVERLALFSLGSVLLHVGEVVASERILRRVADGGDLGDMVVMRARSRLGDLLVEMGRPDDGAAVFRGLLNASRVLGVRSNLREIHAALLASALIPSGGWQEAAMALDAAVGDGTSRAALWPLMYRTWLRVWQGDVPRAGDDLAAAERIVGTTHNARSGVLYVRALVAHAEGNFDAARQAIADIVELNTDVRYDTLPLAVPFGMEVEADRAVAASARRSHEEVAEARRIGASLSDLMARIVAGSGERGSLPTLRGLAARVAAERTRLDGASDPAAFQDAAQRLDDAGRRYEAATCRFRAAEAILESAGPRSQARGLLQEAWRTASRIGASGLERKVTELAARSRIDLAEGATARPATQPRVAVPADPYGLTPREQAVLALVAAGHSNRQIAEHLFIAESTAGVHVSNIIGKLGVQGRAGAAAIGVRLGLVADGASGADG